MSAAPQLAITNVINISVSQANAGVGAYNTSNLGLFTSELPSGWTGGQTYAAYVSPTQVGTDFGTSSKTYAMANAVFSQTPNILAGGGQLIVMLLTPASQTLTFSGIAASGAFVFNYGGHASASIAYTSSAAAIQTILQAISGLSEVLVTGSIAGQLLTVQYVGVYGPLSLATITSNTLETSGIAPITITVATSVAGIALDAAITTFSTVVQFFGIVVTANCAELTQAELLAAAAVVLPLNKIFFAVSNQSADISPGGMLDLLRSGGFTNTRGLYYGDSVELSDIVMCASYAGRALSVNFLGSNTTISMHLQTLNGVQPDPTITQTLLNNAQTAGADCYISLQGDSAVFTSGANQFFDQVYNLQWLIGALQVAGYNYLAGASTKIPQTENGMTGLKGAYRNVCEQAVTNAYLAPGSWNSSVTFGSQTDLLANIAQIGYYIYSAPISQQSQTARAARQAPLVQIAAKQAGAIQSSTVIVNVNA